MPNKTMITIPMVVITVSLVLIASLIIIIFYYYFLKKSSPKVNSELSNTDVNIADGLDDIKIICK